MDNKPLILVIEDDKPIIQFITVALIQEGYRCETAGNGTDGLKMITLFNPDAVILDLGLPLLEGNEIIKKVREWSQVPIIVVSAREHEREKVAALDLGADDYLTKPFSIVELLARIRVALRHRALLPETDTSVFSVGELEINFLKRRVIFKNEEVHLTPIEFRILTLLAKNAGKVLTHHFIIKEIWGPYLSNDNQLLRVFMAGIRRKLEVNPAQPRYIFTEIGVGYRMADE